MKTQVANGISFDDFDIVNLDDYDPDAHGGVNKTRPFLFHDHGFTLCVCFANNLRDALDIAVDADKLARYRIERCEEGDYTKTDWEDGRISYLGNACHLYDIDLLGVHELDNPPMSVAALYRAVHEGN